MYIVDQETVLSVEPRDVNVSSVGDVAVFSCQLDGIPTPRTQWYRDNDRINATAAAAADDDDDDHYIQHSGSGLSVLEIHTLSDDDAGYFRCQASNGVKQSVVSRSAHLSFNATPSPMNRCMNRSVGFV